ncbi:PHP domain-containing protein, partial [Paraburkholderia ferrariae]
MPASDFGGLPAYAELQCASNFSFLRGASHADDLAARAAQLGYSAIAVTDECSLAGVVRAHLEAKKAGIPFIVGSEFVLTNGDGAPALRFTGLAMTREGYGNLSELITLARMRADKGSYRLATRDLDHPEPVNAHLKGLPDCIAIPHRVQEQIEHELALIADLDYEPYFLTVYDIVRFARNEGILCQGRGSAANSAVCYCLGVTEVDPARSSMLFERFISKERGEPPDIDVDFEHQRREEVVQYIYRKYGLDRAALTAAVTTYRPRSALRESGKALGVDPAVVNRAAKAHHWFDSSRDLLNRFAEAGLDPEAPLIAQWAQFAVLLLGFPRHLSQHSGGFVISRGKLSRLVPIENAAMAERSIIQWDKDDIEALGLLKIDVLALGMLSAVRRALDLIAEKRGEVFELQDIPAEDPATYEMICRADTVGVFQIESRAQMSMLPRLQPRQFYDLVIEVAIVRPGPVQGGMVHPYLRRRQGIEPVTFPSPQMEQALARTLGVPIFQEQVMQVAMLAAGFSAGEADQLRRAMAAWRRKGGLGVYYDRIVNGMLARGYDREFAEQIFAQIQGFGEYGFPESHAASFALMVYASAWLKCH